MSKTAYVIKTEHGYLPNEDYRVEYWEEGYWAQNLYEAYFFMDKDTAQGFIGNIVPPPCCGALKECKVLRVSLIEEDDHD